MSQHDGDKEHNFPAESAGTDMCRSKPGREAHENSQDLPVLAF